jgi:hypothetical protein
VLRGHRVISSLLLVVVALPVLLSPTHPVSVYGFLACRFAGFLFAAEPVDHGDGLPAFLTSGPQVARYRQETCRDMRDAGGGLLFAITRANDGVYRHAELRTWNSFLPDSLPTPIRTFMDYKEIPYLGDEVALWLRGESIVAMGHYHPFGGGPSRGDRLARRFSSTSEIIVSNGLIPFVYLDGQLLSYGEAGPLNTDVFRSIRMMEKNLTMALEEVPLDVARPTAALRSFLAYLKEFRQVDIADKGAIGAEVIGLCNEFRIDYAPAFAAGFSSSGYPDDLDRATMLSNLSATEMWGSSIRSIKVASVRLGVPSVERLLTGSAPVSVIGRVSSGEYLQGERGTSGLLIPPESEY